VNGGLQTAFSFGFSDLESGKGTTIVKGKSSLADTLYLDGGRVLENMGNFGGGTIVLGSNPAGKTVGGGTLINAASGTLEIKTSLLAGTGKASFVNAGKLIKSSTGSTATISAPTTNSGSISVTDGTLDFEGLFTNTNAKSGAITVAASTTLDLNGGGSSAAGAISVASGGKVDIGKGIFTLGSGTIGGGGTVEVEGTLSLGTGAVVPTVTLERSGAVAIAQTGAIATKLANFNTGNSLDLTGLTFTGAATIGFAEASDNTQGTLTITEGALSASITLFGQYVAAGFHAAQDSGSGTSITYNTSSPALEPHLAPHH
jgi:hypothetical protein